MKGYIWNLGIYIIFMALFVSSVCIMKGFRFKLEIALVIQS